MTNALFTICIFCIVLFLYLHILYHLKTSNDLKIFEISDNFSKDQFEEACNLRQPLLFSISEKMHLELISFCTKQKNNIDQEKKVFIYNNCSTFNENIPLFLSLSDCFQLIKKNTNDDEIKKNCFVATSDTYASALLSPPFTSNSFFHILAGNKNAFTPLKYEVNFRNFFLCLSGTVKIILFPPENEDVILPNENYLLFQFGAKNISDPWAFSSSKSIELVLSTGKAVFIPAYWWYSIQFVGDCVMEENILFSLQYRTYLNTLAIMPKLLLYFFQINNIKNKINKNNIDGIKNTIENKKNKIKNKKKN